MHASRRATSFFIRFKPPIIFLTNTRNVPSKTHQNGLWSDCIPALLVFCEFIIKLCAVNGKFKKV